MATTTRPPHPHTQRFDRDTWLEPEALCYPAGGMTRRARAVLTANPHNPLALPYGALRTVRCGMPDTFSSIRARLRVEGRTVRGYLTVLAFEDHLSFIPEADPARCPTCQPGDGCRREA